MTAAATTTARSDAELLASVERADLDPKRAAEAQAELYSRHVRYLYGLLVQRQRRLLELAGLGAEDLVHETFHRAFERAHTFDAGGIEDPDRLRQRTRAWLGRIARNLLADALAGAREVSATPYLDQLSCDGIDAAPSRPSPKLRIIQQGLAQLSEREQDVLRVTALYHRAGAHQRLPNAVSAELAERWGTSNENVRAIRSRAMKKLAAFCAEHAGGDFAPAREDS